MNRHFKQSALLILLISSFFIFSCKKNDTTNTTGQIPDLTTKVNASVSGFVTDENNAALQGATATFRSLKQTLANHIT